MTLTVRQHAYQTYCRQYHRLLENHLRSSPLPSVLINLVLEMSCVSEIEHFEQVIATNQVGLEGLNFVLSTGSITNKNRERMLLDFDEYGMLNIIPLEMYSKLWVVMRNHIFKKYQIASDHVLQQLISSL